MEGILSGRGKELRQVWKGCLGRMDKGGGSRERNF